MQINNKIMGWTKPTTEAQIAYYNRKAPERKAYGFLIPVTLLAWGFTAFFGVRLLLDSAAAYVPALAWLSPWLAAGIVICLHGFLFATVRTYFFDRMDDDPLTDSPLWIPLIISLALLVVDRIGNKTIIERYGHTATVQSTATIDSLRTASLTEEKKRYEAAVADIEKVYADKEKATAMPYDAAISDLRRKQANTGKAYPTLISEQRSKKEAALAAVATEKAAELKGALTAYQDWAGMVSEAHKQNKADLDRKNGKELSKEAATQTAARSGSWLIAAFFCLVFWVCNWRFVQISLRSGIRPIYPFTELESRGSVFSWYWLVFQDIYKRQAIRFAVFIHRIGTGGTRQLDDLDGGFEFREGSYQRPAKPSLPSPYPNGKPVNGNHFQLDLYEAGKKN